MLISMVGEMSDCLKYECKVRVAVESILHKGATCCFGGDANKSILLLSRLSKRPSRWLIILRFVTGCKQRYPIRFDPTRALPPRPQICRHFITTKIGAHPSLNHCFLPSSLTLFPTSISYHVPSYDPCREFYTSKFNPISSHHSSLFVHTPRTVC